MKYEVGMQSRNAAYCERTRKQLLDAYYRYHMCLSPKLVPHLFSLLHLNMHDADSDHGEVQLLVIIASDCCSQF